MHAYIHAYVRTYIHTYIHSFIHSCIHSFIHVSMPTHTHIYIYISRHKTHFPFRFIMSNSQQCIHTDWQTVFRSSSASWPYIEPCEYLHSWFGPGYGLVLTGLVFRALRNCQPKRRHPRQILTEAPSKPPPVPASLLRSVGHLQDSLSLQVGRHSICIHIYPRFRIPIMTSVDSRG